MESEALGEIVCLAEVVAAGVVGSNGTADNG